MHFLGRVLFEITIYVIRFIWVSIHHVVSIGLKFRELRMKLEAWGSFSLVCCSTSCFWSFRLCEVRIDERRWRISCSTNSWLCKAFRVRVSDKWLRVPFFVLLINRCKISSPKVRRSNTFHRNLILIRLSRTDVLLLWKITHRHVISVSRH